MAIISQSLVRGFAAILLPIATPLLACREASAQQVADSTFAVSVANPAHTQSHPVVLIDEAHRNFHTAEGRYAPFAKLLRHDGYTVTRATEPITAALLRDVAVYVIVNAAGDTATGKMTAAFTENECDLLADWVRAGGSLLFVADHAPYGEAAQNLARRFGVEFGKGFVHDSTSSLANARLNLVFSRESGTIGDHPITRGRDSTERVRRVIAFRGQSLTLPEAGSALLKFTDHARESPTEDDVWARGGVAVRGRSQGIAFVFGRGRVVILGEAAMLSAQIARWEEDGKWYELKMGMNYPGSDNKQLALNIVRWLTRVLN